MVTSDLTMDKITKEDIIEAENQLFAAQLASDVDALDLLLYDSLVAIAPDGQMLTKEMDLNAHRSKAMVIEQAATEINAIKLVGDTALSVVTMTAKGQVMGAPLEGKFRYFRTWKRIDNSLKVIGASFMQLPS
ncbi:MAG TPA: nuclear transport factor 2 family protein [Sphingobacterium sp.]|nr:nuclear transport factor 2 family protein [Sphingobacterium sp.]HAF34982.1 nuclear transport factor 2 family protein [Sphingobacterium sp.]HAL52392.1 nuclear transport factor 2 family protein [Sphingobacterium sp.]HAT93227.1 nuclear transport factor 2 family protein [Sphingobacterium sp.]HAU53631.1 nuclear transport factor 2 family protein [Sphingobacterium sp.]